MDFTPKIYKSNVSKNFQAFSLTGQLVSPLIWTKGHECSTLPNLINFSDNLKLEEDRPTLRTNQNGIRRQGKSKVMTQHAPKI